MTAAEIRALALETRRREAVNSILADVRKFPEDPDFMSHYGDQGNCPDRPHRGPEGPNEDLSQCLRCFALSWSLRPEGEEYGGHAADCSLPRRHESYCVGGGEGHPPANVTRGYWPARPAQEGP